MRDADVVDALLKSPRDPALLVRGSELYRARAPAFMARIHQRYAAHKALLSPLEPAPSPAGRWENWSGTQKVDTRELLKPRDLRELRWALHYASKQGRRLRVVATGHSFSDIVQGEDKLLDATCLARANPTGLLPLEDELWRRRPRETLVRVQAGAKIRTVNRALESAGLAMPNLGGFTGQTLVGAVSTSTHGSGIQLPPFPDLVRSLDLAATFGRMWRIEPSDGPTDPDKFYRRYPRSSWVLKQDDDFFNSAIVSLGCMGVIWSMTIAVTHAYRLRQHSAEVPWSMLRHEINSGRLYRNHRHVEVYVSPYARHGDYRAIVARRDMAPPDDFVDRSGYRWPRDRNGIDPPTRRFAEWFVSQDFAQGAEVWFMNLVPDVVDGVMTAALDNRLDPTVTTQKSFELFDLGPPNNVRTRSAEYAVPLDKAAVAVDRMLELAAWNRRRHGYIHNIPIALRFVKQSRAYLSMMHERPCCTIEAHMISGTDGACESLMSYEDALYAYEARPHWGQMNFHTARDGWISRNYPKLASWREVQRRLNPLGIFDNHFTDRHKLSIRPLGGTT